MQTALNWLRTMFSLVKEINKKSSTSCMDFVYFGSCMDFRCVTECMEIRFPYILSHICHTSEILFVLSVKPFCLKPPSIHREGMPGHMCSEHAAVRWSVPTGDCGDVRRPLLLPQGLQWCVTDPAGRFSNVPGLCLPLRSHAQVQLWTSLPQLTFCLFLECVQWIFIQVLSGCRLEQAKEDESKDALKDLVNLVTCLTTYGVTELKPAGLTTGAPFLLPGFVLPQPSWKGMLMVATAASWSLKFIFLLS